MSSLPEGRANDEFVSIRRSTLKAIGEALEATAYTQLSMHKLASGLFDAPEMHEAFLHAVRDMTRSAVKRLQACMSEIEGSPHLGNFSDELAEDGL